MYFVYTRMFHGKRKFFVQNYINCQLYIRTEFYYTVQTWLENIHYLQAKGCTVPTTVFLCHPVFYVEFNFCAVLLPKCCHANQSCVNRFSPWQLYYSHSNNIGNISAESKSAYFAMVLSFVPGLLSYAGYMCNVYILWFWNVIYTICNIHSTYV